MAKANWMSDPLIGHQLANFRIEKVVGRGGMATVYQGLDIVLNRPVAVKVIHQLYRDNPVYTRRMQRESQMIATWRHPNIVQVYYADFENEVPYFIMEYVDGPDLRHILDSYHSQDELMPVDDVLRIAEVLADALDFAHKQGVIHRDIKPSNIMVSKTGTILLTDFGLALELKEGTLGESFGTPHYMAPEQAKQASDAIPASDLYSLGVILYEMLTGHLPFEADAITGVIIKSLTADLPDATSFNPELPVAINDVFQKALSRDVLQRYKSGQEFIGAATAALGKNNTSLESLENLVTNLIEQEKTAVALNADPSLASRLVLSLSNRQRLDKIIQSEIKGNVHPDSFPATQPDRPPFFAGRIFGADPSLPLRSAIWPWILGGVIFFFGLFAAIWGFQRINAEPPAVAIVTVDNTPTFEPEPTELSGTMLPPVVMTTAEAEEENATVMTEPTATLTFTPVPIDTTTPVPTTIPSSTPPSPTPTRIDKPDVILIYESPNAMYVYNPTDVEVDVSLLSFTALDGEMNQLEWGYNARFWGRTTIEPQKCNALEIGQPRPNLRDPRCTDFNWINNPGSQSTARFWVERPEENVELFAVFWGGELVRTCAIDAKVCRIELPES